MGGRSVLGPVPGCVCLKSNITSLFFRFYASKSFFVRVCIRSLTLEINSHLSQLSDCVFLFFRGKHIDLNVVMRRRQ